MTDPTLQLTVITQEQELLSTTAESVTATTTDGELTILPNHLPLFAKLVPSELIFRRTNAENSLVISSGFLEMGSNNQLTVMVDSASQARDLSEEQAQKAIRQAHQTMTNSNDRSELLRADAELKRAMLELKVARKSKKSPL